MNDCPIVSIITPSFNQGRFLEDTIKSVLSQQGDFHLDYVIVDGGSTDNSLEVIKRYDVLIKEKRYSYKCRSIQYRWSSERDEGQSDAINKGFRMAKGKILAWLNSDDCYEPDALSTVVKEFNEAKNHYIVFGDCNVIDEAGHRVGYCRGKIPNPNNYIKYWQKDYTIPQPAVFFHRDILRRVGYLDENFHYVMDYDFWLRIRKLYKFHYINKPLAIMRVHNLAKSSLSYELFEREWAAILKKNWSDFSWGERIECIMRARNFRSNVIRINAYLKMDKLSLTQFRKKIFSSIISNPFNLFKVKFMAALFRAIVGHRYSDQIKNLLNKK